ncbi:hypothetical protein ACE38W_00675 [Chitinophaga sp. Hz27]|uniref:hypothetical protein n=1 Tax=Chitinophaga sp. Hz27 TaxID=3347169 RepID=UPI0035DC64CB
MKKLSVLFFFLLSLSCGKKDATPALVEIIYEVSSNAHDPFDSVSYTDANATTRTGMTDWKINGPGEYSIHAYVKKGAGAFLDAQHPNSDQWKLRIKKLDGTVIAESGTIRKGTGNPSSYTGGCQIQIN